jgi:hypothetical protein
MHAVMSGFADMTINEKEVEGLGLQLKRKEID